MYDAQNAARAYNAASGHRSPRAQEADVFRRVNGGLRSAREADPLARAKALADNRRLWQAVTDLVRDPANAMDAPLRAAIASVGIAVLREMERAAPGYDFLIAVNENIADGLDG